MRIVVNDGGVQVYMEAADVVDCSCTAFLFPAVGVCSFLSDANPCNGSPVCSSCLTDIHVEVNGVPLTPTGYGGRDPWTRYYGTFPSGELSLVIAGCGHPTTHISLDGPAFLQTTVTADYVSGAVPHVSWATDAPAPTTLLTLYGNQSELCHVQDVSEYTFTGLMYAVSVGVQAFGSRADIDTELGHATIWRAGAAGATFPSQP